MHDFLPTAGGRMQPQERKVLRGEKLPTHSVESILIKRVSTKPETKLAYMPSVYFLSKIYEYRTPIEPNGDYEMTNAY